MGEQRGEIGTPLCGGWSTYFYGARRDCSLPLGHEGNHRAEVDGRYVARSDVVHDVAETIETMGIWSHRIVTLMIARTLCKRTIQGLPTEGYRDDLRPCSQCSKALMLHGRPAPLSGRTEGSDG